MNNDLISREGIRKAVNDCYDSKFKGLVPRELIDYAESVDNLIDNAPTVEVYTKDDMAGAYNEGYMCGSREAEKARPQGEWAQFKCGYRCSNCDDIEVYKPNFCPNCGALMVSSENN